MTVALEHLRSDEKGMVDGSKVLLAGAGQAGVAMTEPQKQEAMHELRPEWGKCLTEPQWRQIDVNTQSDQQFRD